jgi:hypothetical protein
MGSDRGQPRRRCFTPLELLVVIDILAVLIALLLPAAQKVREGAARAESRDRIRQLPPLAPGAHERLLPSGEHLPISTGLTSPSCRGAVRYYFLPGPGEEGTAPVPRQPSRADISTSGRIKSGAEWAAR